MTLQSEHCFLCNEVVNESRRIPLVGSLLLSADIAPLIGGHSLVYTDDHRTSFAQSEERVLKELSCVLAKLPEVPYFSNAELFLFEHGPGPDGTSIAGCCDHAHVHILPLTNRTQNLPSLVDAEISKYLTSGVATRLGEFKLNEITKLNRENYIWYGADINRLMAFRLDKAPRQFLRKLVANANGENSFQSWECYDLDAAKQLSELLYHQISNICVFDQAQQRIFSEIVR